MISPAVQGRLLVRNTALNLAGQVLPLALGFIAVPLVIRGLGTERYGIWSLVTVVIIYFALFDLGLGRATTKFVAESLGQKEIQRIPGIVWTSLLAQFILGTLGALVLVLLTPFLAAEILNIPVDLLPEARNTFYVIGAALPFILCASALRGVLEANQRFDLVNAVTVPHRSLVSFVPVIGIWLGFSMPGIASLLLLVQLAVSLVLLYLCLKENPELRLNFRVDRSTLRPLFYYGGWLTVVNATAPILNLFDRFLIGALLSVTAVAHYAPAQNLAIYLWIIPSSLTLAMLPAVSYIGRARKEQLELLTIKALKALILVMGPIVIIVVLFGKGFLELWLGTEFAEASNRVLQILAVGFFLNSISWVPSTLLQGVGRPDLVAKFFVLELPLYLTLLWFLINQMGIEGAATAWAARGGVEVVGFILIAWKTMGFQLTALTKIGLPRAAVSLSLLALVAFGLQSAFSESKPMQMFTTVGLFVLFAALVWRFALENAERSGFKTALMGFRTRTEALR